MSAPDAVRIARAGLARLMEPSDLTGLALVAVAGPEEAFRLIGARDGKAPAREQQAVAELLEGVAASRAEHRLDAGLERWRPRLPDAAPARDLDTMRRLGGGLLVPEDAGWPGQFDALGLGAPLCLWWRGAVEPAALPPVQDLMAVVGSRDATAYGRQVTSELASALVREAVTVVSGGAYGIDARAHEAALAAFDGLGGPAGTGATATAPGTLPGPCGGRPPTVAVMAGGLDRFYPAGNEDLLRRVAAAGVLLAEVSPGTAPTRWRFLQRNRLIAALCAATVVVEARWRSGALTTAHRAAEMGREVGAVPGSVYSANSAGCHRLLREGAALAVTDAAEALELLGGRPRPSSPTGSPGGERAPAHPLDVAGGGDTAGSREAVRSRDAARPHDGLDIQDLLLLDALPVRSASTPDKLAVVAGLGIGAVLGGLSRLQARGLARRLGDGWQRTRPD
ncbi:DNA-processing protein DprA [Arthrobacter ginkgonis]|uniref:DNA-processing protein DprA n=1 Tax=Arthrobacter ginkgonis TaxID=1630594 RepID=A0ABP7BWH6_9MICC